MQFGLICFTNFGCQIAFILHLVNIFGGRDRQLERPPTVRVISNGTLLIGSGYKGLNKYKVHNRPGKHTSCVFDVTLKR